MAEQNLEIRVNFKAGDAESGLTRLKGLIESVDRASQGRGFTQLSGVADSMTQLGLAAKNIKDIGPYFEQVAKSAEGLFKTFQSFDPKSYASRVAALSGSLRTVGDAMRSFVDGASGMSSKVSENVKNASESVGKMGSSAKTSARSVSLSFSDVGNNMKKVVSLGYQVAKLPFKMILAPIQGIGRGLSNMTGHFSKFLSGIGRIALYRAIRTGIKLVTTAVREGVNNVYEWATIVGNSFQRTMDMIATSSNYLKNSIGAMFSPILDAIAPVLDAIVDKAVTVINVVNQLIATLTGATSWRRAEKVATSYSGAADGIGKSASGANDKVKELKRTLLGFDEINRLEADSKNPSSNPGSGSGSGSSVPGGSLAFTEQPITSAVKNLADKLRDAWAKADFTEIGNMIGTKIGNALSSVPWDDKIKPFVVKLAKSAGTLLNGMFDYTGSGGKAMWDGIAYTIYNALNTAVLGYVTFFDTVHWNGIGQGIGAALKRVLDNLDWGMIARALAAFPNAVIDAVTGFSKRFTTQDFYNAGQNIGRTISNALVLIDWTGLFGNALNIATGVLAALNGALENFDWKGVKEAILNGIKKIPKDTWSNLGTEIGRAIFNIVNFAAHLIDTMVSVIENGGWGDLFGGIKKGIENGLKQYGGWTGVAQTLADWLGKNIGTLNIIFAIAVGLPLLKSLPAAFASTVMTGLMAKRVPGTGSPLGAWVKSLSIAAGIVLAIDTFKAILDTDFDKGDLHTKLENVMGIAVRGAVSGALVGFGIGGFTGGLYGIIIGAGLSLSISALKTLADKLKAGDKTSFLTELGGGIIGSALGAAIGLTFGPGGAIVGGVLGFGIGVKLTLLIEDLIPKLGEGAVQLAKETWEGSMLQGILNSIFGDGNATYKVDMDKMDSAIHAYDKWSDEDLETAFGGGRKRASVAAQDSNRVGSADTKSTPFKFSPVVDLTKLPTEWQNLAKAWESITKKNKVAKFITEGIRNDGLTWWERVKEYWGTAISGKNAKRFTIEGIVNQAQNWWGQVTNFWRSYISGKNAARFTTEGVTNQATTWWGQLAGFWNNIIGYAKAGPFSIQGIVNDAWQWWNQTQSYWSQATYGSSLGASVEIGNPWNAFVSAFNSMQSYFNSHPLTAVVKTATQAVTTAINASKSYQSSGTKSNSSTKVSTSKNSVLNLGDDAINALKKKKKKATGGVYKNGQWHDITKYAAGSLGVQSGEMFIAREAGPELVGSIGGNTAVMNNNQIVASVAAGVAQAVSSVMGNGGTNEITIKVDSETLYKAVRKGERRASGRYGTTVAIG